MTAIRKIMAESVAKQISWEMAPYCLDATLFVKQALSLRIPPVAEIVLDRLSMSLDGGSIGLPSEEDIERALAAGAFWYALARENSLVVVGCHNPVHLAAWMQMTHAMTIRIRPRIAEHLTMCDRRLKIAGSASWGIVFEDLSAGDPPMHDAQHLCSIEVSVGRTRRQINTPDRADVLRISTWEADGQTQ